MADAPTNDSKQPTPQQPVWSGGTPVTRLETDQLPSNPKRIIRTFSSDMQALQSGNKPMPVSATAPTPAPQPAQEPTPAPPRPPTAAPISQPPAKNKVTLAEAVTRIRMAEPEPTPASEPHLPPLQKQRPMYVQRPEAVPPPLPRRAPPPIPISEGIVHEKEPSFLTKLFYALFGARHTTPSAFPPPVIQTPGPVPPPPVPAPVFTPTVEPPIAEQVPSTNATQEAADREAVLARLRARVSTYQSQDVPPPPTFPTPPPAALPRPAPQPLRAPPPNLPGMSVSADSDTPERIHTFSSDFKNETNARDASAFSILAAQADAQRPVTETVTTETRLGAHGLAYALAATVLVVGGSLVLYFTYNYFLARSPVPILSSAPSGLISGDTSTTISGTGSSLMSALVGATNANLSEGDVELVYLSMGTTTLGGSGLVNALELPAPSILLRNLGDTSSVGILHSGDETRVFFILSATSYERTFAGMLAWEPTIAQDLAQLYPSYGAEQSADASSTPVTTVRPGFVDETVANHDVRALKDAQNRTVLVYGFRDQGTLIIARDETAFGALLARLSASQ